jgi:hypothetical protein
MTKGFSISYKNFESFKYKNDNPLRFLVYFFNPRLASIITDISSAILAPTNLGIVMLWSTFETLNSD